MRAPERVAGVDDDVKGRALPLLALLLPLLLLALLLLLLLLLALLLLLLSWRRRVEQQLLYEVVDLRR